MAEKHYQGLLDLNRKEWESRLAAPCGKYTFSHRYRIAHERIIKRKPSHWLDVGTGNGYLPSVVKPDLPGVTVTGVDFVAEVLAGARDLDDRRVVDLDAEALPFGDAAFDYVTCMEVLEHLVLPMKLLAEMSRVLEPGGFLLISVPNIQFLEYVFDLLRGKVPRPASDPRHMSIFTLKHLMKIMTEAGFAITHTASCDASPPWLARLSKRYLGRTILVEGENQARIRKTP